MLKLAKTYLVGLAATAGLLASSLVVVGPAQAYGNLTVRYAEYNPNTCNVFRGTLPVARYPDGRCVTSYPVDNQVLNSWPQPDPNSRAVAVQLWNGSELVAYVQFHPYDEYLHVVDTENDGDAIYVEFWIENPDDPNDPDRVGVFTPPGTSAVVDFGEFNLNVPDGRPVTISVFDDAGTDDLIVGAGAFFGIA